MVLICVHRGSLLTIARQVWISLPHKFASHSRARVHHFMRELQTFHQGSMNFLEKAKLLSDELAAFGKAPENESYDIVSSLNSSFNPFITSLHFITRDKTISFEDSHNELLSY
ncbi:hypothetical protein SADUNF_Sadunf04G0065600 [Salix dunnii]|uniref:Uncharacterized protein n=1 Tax=Salix dunnii TaxID=1413687 RepID=A0A835KAH4_9ROSI|nr:hypothetical protein SADUNF_Sadunf04G0065600 [Salix dunnii]